MTDTVQVPREATSEMMQAGLEAMRTENVRDTSENGRCARIYAAMIAAAPQATDPRDAKLTNKIAAIGDAWIKRATEQEARAEAAESRIATLTAERDALREALDEAIELASQDDYALTPAGEAMIARWTALTEKP